MPKSDFPGTVAPVKPPQNEAVGDCCAMCRFWNHAQSQETPGGQSWALCRRYPPTIAVIPVPVPDDPRVIQRGNQPAGTRMIPQPMPVRPSSESKDYCGEFVSILGKK